MASCSALSSLSSSRRAAVPAPFSSRSSVAGPALRGARLVMHAKEGLHPEYFKDAKVICNGQEVMVVGGTKPTYNVDIYSGNHPFYQGNKASMVLDDGQLNKFKKRFQDLEDVFAVSNNTAATAVFVKPVKAGKKGGKK